MLSTFCPPLVTVLSTQKFVFDYASLLIWLLMELPLFMLYAEEKFIGYYPCTAHTFIVSHRDLGVR